MQPRGQKIEARHLTKRYWSTVAVNDLSFDVNPGMVTGFIGPNGAGKTTTMRLILGLDHPSEGQVTVGGKRYQDLPAPMREVGALIDAKAVHPSRSAYHHLLSLAQSNNIAPRRVHEVLALVGLEAVAGKKVGTFSLGMGQRLGIAAALLGDPPVLMFDEPFNGMDPEGIVWLRGFLKSLAAQGRAVLVSSHLMSELQDTAGRVVAVGRGRVLADSSMAELIAGASAGHVTVRTTAPAKAATTLAQAGAEVAAAGSGELLIKGVSAERTAALLTEHAIAFSEVSEHRATLEEAYLDLTREAVEFRAAAAEVASW